MSAGPAIRGCACRMSESCAISHLEMTYYTQQPFFYFYGYWPETGAVDGVCCA